jgi:hypothetical protein
MVVRTWQIGSLLVLVLWMASVAWLLHAPRVVVCSVPATLAVTTTPAPSADCETVAWPPFRVGAHGHVCSMTTHEDLCCLEGSATLALRPSLLDPSSQCLGHPMLCISYCMLSKIAAELSVCKDNCRSSSITYAAAPRESLYCPYGAPRTPAPTPTSAKEGIKK